MAATTDEILDAIAAELGIERAQLQPSARLERLDVDSLSMIAAGQAIERRFGATIEQGDLKGLDTLGDLVELVRSRSGGAGG